MSIIRFILEKLFGVRRDHIVECPTSKGKPAYKHVLEPVTETEIQKHLDGNITLMSYAIDNPKDSLLTYGFLDVDNGTFLNPILDVLKKRFQENKFLIEASNDARYHIWFFFDQPIHISAFVGLLRDIVTEAGLQGMLKPDSLEIIPEKPPVEELGGKPCRVFLGTNLKTGYRKHFIDFQGQEVDPATVLGALVPIPSATISLQPTVSVPVPVTTSAMITPPAAGMAGLHQGMLPLPCIQKILTTAIPKGGRNKTVLAVTAFLKKLKHAPDVIKSILTTINASFNPPLSAAELDRTAMYVLKKNYNITCTSKYIKGYCTIGTNQTCPALKSVVQVQVGTEPAREQIAAILTLPRKVMSDYDRYEAVADIIIKDLERRNVIFFINDERDPALKIGAKELRIDAERPGHELGAFFAGEYRAIPKTKEWPYIIYRILGYSRDHYIPLTSNSVIGGSITTPNIYLALCDVDDTILEIVPGKITPMLNGANPDKILLSTSTWSLPLKYLPDVVVADGLKILYDEILSYIPCDSLDMYLMAAWTIAIFVARKPITSRPAIFFEGGSGTGKTSSLRLIGYLLSGRDPITNSTLSAEKIIAARSLITIIDNMEAQDWGNRELLRFALQAVTTARFIKRKLYSDNKTVEIEINTFLLLGGIEGPLSKEEFLQRTLHVQIKDAYKSKTVSPDIFDTVLKKRDLVLNAVFKFIAETILPKLQGDGYNQIVNKFTARYRNHPKIRSAEFLSLMELTLDELSKILPIPQGVFSSVMRKQAAVARDTSESNNPIIDLLNRYIYLLRHGTGREVATHSNVFLERKTFRDGDNIFEFDKEDKRWKITFTTIGLKTAFDTVVKEYNLTKYDYPLRSSGVLIKRMLSLQNSLKDLGYELETGAGGKINGTLHHIIRLPIDVPDDELEAMATDQAFAQYEKIIAGLNTCCYMKYAEYHYIRWQDESVLDDPRIDADDAERIMAAKTTKVP